MSDDSEFEQLDRLVGTWTTAARHPAMPGVVVRGTATIGWLEGRHSWSSALPPTIVRQLELMEDDANRKAGAAVHSWNTRNQPRRFALLAGFVMVGEWPKAATKCGFATKQAARQPLKRARARPISE